MRWKSGRRRRRRRGRRRRKHRNRKHRRCRCLHNRKLQRRRCLFPHRRLRSTRFLLHRHSLRSRARISPNTLPLLRLLARRHHHLAHNSHNLPRHMPCHHSLRRRERILLPRHSPRRLKNRLVHPYTYSLLAISKARLCSRYQRTTSTILVRAKISWLLCLVWLTRSA